MARGKLLAMSITLDDVLAAAQRLGELDPEKIGALLVDTLNTTIDDAYDTGRARMTAGINLTDTYVRSKMVVRHATAGLPRAEIVAPVRDKSAYTNISHYGAMQRPVRDRWTNADITARGHKFGEWPGWTKRKGAEYAGIPVDKKAHTIEASVSRGSPKSIGKKFVIQKGGGVVKDREGNPLVFRNIGPGGKKGKGRIEPVLGPSVYQLFRAALPKLEEDIDDTFVARVQAVAEREFDKALK